MFLLFDTLFLPLASWKAPARFSIYNLTVFFLTKSISAKEENILLIVPVRVSKTAVLKLNNICPSRLVHDPRHYNLVRAWLNKTVTIHTLYIEARESKQPLVKDWFSYFKRDFLPSY